MAFSTLLLAFMAASAQAPPNAASPLASGKEERICRASESQLGSRIRKRRRCQTAAQWEVEDALRDRVPASLRVTEGQPLPGQPTRPQ